MFIKKTALAILMSSFISVNSYAISSDDIESSDISINQIYVDFTKDSFLGDYTLDSEIAYFTHMFVSGDGKTILTLVDGGGSHSQILSTDNLKKVIQYLPYINNNPYFIYSQSTNKNGDIIVPKPTMYFKKEGGEWKSYDTGYGNSNRTLLGVTGSGQFYTVEFSDDYSKNFYRLRDSNNFEHVLKEKIFDRDVGTIYMVSEDGSVLIGDNQSNVSLHSPILANEVIVLYGNDWNKEKILYFAGVIDTNDTSDNSSGISWLTQLPVHLSPNGKIVFKGYHQGWVYSGEDYQTKTVLTKRLPGSNQDEDFIFLESANYDGSIIVGSIGKGFPKTGDKDDKIQMRPVIWYGTNWANIKDLGTLGGKATDGGVAHSISWDGDVIVGLSHNAERKLVPTLWRLLKQGNNTDIVIVDIDKTRKIISDIAKDNFNMFENQRYGLISLLEGCDVEQNSQGHYCVSLRSNLTGQSKFKEGKIGFSAAYKLTDNLSTGIVLDKTVYNNFDNSYKKSNNLGLGIYANWKHYTDNSEFYIRPALSFNQAKLSIERPILSGSETAEGQTKMKGISLSLTLGQKYQFNQDKLGWFVGARHNRLVQNAYQDNAKGFPINYSKMKYKDTTLFVGLDYNKPLTDKLNWLSMVEFEQRILRKNPTFKAYNQYIGESSLNYKMPKNAITFATGIEYKLNQNFRLNFMPSITKNNASPLRWNIALNLTGQF